VFPCSGVLRDVHVIFLVRHRLHGLVLSHLTFDTTHDAHALAARSLVRLLDVWPLAACFA
jgi:hypothetical protein